MGEKHKYKKYSDVEVVDIIHQVSTLYTATRVPHDYGTGEVYTSVEVHTLKHIADQPGITVTELARNEGKTKGAVSQILKKIEEKGLILREYSQSNDNRCNLYLTEKGQALDRAHRKFDEVNFGESMNRVRKAFSDDEINTAFQVMETWLSVRREIQQERLKRQQLKEVQQ